MSIKDKIDQLLNESKKLQNEDDEVDAELDKKVQEACDDEKDDKKTVVAEDEEKDSDDDSDDSEEDDKDSDEDDKDEKKNPFVKESFALVEALTKKDFITVAGIVHQVTNSTDKQKMADLFASWFAGQNPQFDSAKFHQACGTKVQANESKLDITEDVDALLNGETLSEEFRLKATTIFEAAVMKRVKSEVALVEEKTRVEQEVTLRELKEELIDKIDGYLDFTVEAWMKNNELALESGIKNEIYENFITKMKTVFVESYIQVPEDRFDLVDGLATEAAKARTELDEAVSVAVEYKRELNELKKQKLIDESAKGLTMTDAERFKQLSEELVFSDDESFKQKLTTIQESYNFGSKEKSKVTSFVTDAAPTLIQEETELTPLMKEYLKHLK